MIRLLAQVLLLIICVAAIAFLAAQTGRILSEPIPLTASANDTTSPHRASAPEPKFTSRPLADLSAAVTKPLFFEGRRFPKSKSIEALQPVASSPAPTIVPSFRLMGIAHHADGWRALIEAPSVLPDWYTEGTKLQGWTLQHIETNSVSLSLSERTIELRLFSDGDRN